MTSPGEELWNEVILSGVSGLSALGSIAIIFTYFLWRDLQTTSRRILVYISFGDFFTVFPTLVIFWTRQYRNDSFSCKLQSFITTTAVMWSFFWTTSLAIYLYVSLVKKRHDVAERLMVIFHIINWCVPAVVVGLAWYNNVLGTTSHESTVGWCWIKNGKSRKDTIIWMLVCGKLWEIITYFINFILYFSVNRNIKKEVLERYHLMSAQSIQIAEQGVRKLALVPIIFVLLRIWGTIRFILFAANVWQNYGSTISTVYVIKQILFTVQIIGDNSQGIANFILFCLLTEKFKTKISPSAQTSSFSKATRREHDGGTFGNPSTDTYHS